MVTSPLPDFAPPLNEGDAATEAVLERQFSHPHWERLHKEQLGVDVQDPDGHTPGMAGIKRKIFGFDVGEWAPVDGKKHVMVGEFDRYQFYNPWTSGDEADFNIFIFPNEPFRFLLDDVVALMSSNDMGELHDRKRGQGHVVECEITPDEEYYDNFWFGTGDNAQSHIVGIQLGVYGPWVRDFGHGGRPEIHPSEVIWWRTGSFDTEGGAHPPMFTRWTIIVLQDDSNRFDRPKDYTGPVTRPWSASPRREHITLAIQATRGELAEYYISIKDGHRVISFPGEDSRTVTRDYQGQSAVTVVKKMAHKPDLRVRVSNLAPDPADETKLRGFLHIDVQVGESDRGKEGFAEIEVMHWNKRQDRPSSGGAPSAGRPSRPIDAAPGESRPREPGGDRGPIFER